MKNFTINHVDIDEAAKVITFHCSDLKEFEEEKLFNEFADENTVPKDYQVSYDMKNSNEVHLLYCLKDTYAEDAKSIREIVSTIASKKNSNKKPFEFPAYWNKEARSWYFRY